ncbi:MAG: hypothetical protein EZS28_041718, partial [Streblomastix strix]
SSLNTQPQKIGDVRMGPNGGFMMRKGEAVHVAFDMWRQVDTDNLVGKMFKVFEASVVSVSDAQVERESRLEGVFQGPQTEDVLSQKTKERFKRKSAKQVIDGRRAYTSFTSNQYHFTAKSNPSPRLNRTYLNAHQNSTQQSISSKSGEQIEAVCWKRNSFDPADELNKAVCWEHVSFDPAKDVERARCGDQGSTDLAAECGDQGSTDLAVNDNDERAGCGDQGSTDLAINDNVRAGCGDQGSTDLAISQDGLAECGDQGSTDSADQLESNQYQQKKQPDKGKQDETETKQTLVQPTILHPANIPIGGRLTHFVDAWKLIGADALVTRGIKAFWIITQAPLNPRKKHDQFRQDKVERQLISSRQIDRERIQRRYHRGGTPQSAKMDQPMLCNPEERARKVEEDHGLFSTIQIPLCNTLYNGGCLESQ